MPTVDATNTRPLAAANGPRNLFLGLNVAVTGGTSGLGLALVAWR